MSMNSIHLWHSVTLHIDSCLINHLTNSDDIPFECHLWRAVTDTFMIDQRSLWEPIPDMFN